MGETLSPMLLQRYPVVERDTLTMTRPWIQWMQALGNTVLPLVQDLEQLQALTALLEGPPAERQELREQAGILLGLQATPGVDVQGRAHAESLSAAITALRVQETMQRTPAAEVVTGLVALLMTLPTRGARPLAPPPNIAVTSAIGQLLSRYAAQDHTHGVPSGFIQLCLPIFAGGADLVLTNQANAEQDLQNNVRYRKTLDLTFFQEFRLIGRLITGSASANNPRIYAQYSTDDTNWLALEAAGSSVLAMVTPGILDTGWLSVVAGAQAASRHVRIAQHGGDGVADPAWGYLSFFFRI